MRRAAVISIACVLAIVGLALAQTGTPQAYLPLIVNPPTATPTLTPTATIAPTATPTQQPTGVFILGNTFSYVDSIDYLHIIGEVQNNTPNIVRFVNLTANFFNGVGQLIDTDFTYAALDRLPPYTKTCFDMSLKQPAGWASYQFEPVTYSPTTTGPPNLTILNDSGSYDPTFGSYRIIGFIRNDEAVQVRFVSVIGTLYNGAGTPVSCDFTYVSSTHLDPAQMSSFNLSTTGRNFSDVVSYRLQAEGTKQ